MLPIIVAINDESDRDFVEDIYNKYGKKMYLVAFGVLKKKVDAEDCVHDVIKIIIDNIERFRNADYNHLINLIVKCTRNDAINKYNKDMIAKVNLKAKLCTIRICSTLTIMTATEIFAVYTSVSTARMP